MTTRVQESIMVNVPVSVAYNQWTQFEEFPQFMGGVTSVTQLSDDRLQWVAQIAGVRRQWEAKILEQVPDRKVAWAATEGATNAGSVEFEDLGGGQTSVRLFLEYEPEGLVEKVGDKLNVVENQAASDLKRFKAFIESEGYATGAWRGQVDPGGHVGTPGLKDAESSRGDSGKAGVSGKVAVGLGAVVAGAAAVAAARSGSGEESGSETASEVEVVPVEPVALDEPVGTAPLGEGSGFAASGTATTVPVDTAGEGERLTGAPLTDVPGARDDATTTSDPMDEIYAASEEHGGDSKRS